MSNNWPAIVRANMIRQNSDFSESHIQDAIEYALHQVIDCTKRNMEWEIIFVGSGDFLIPEITLLQKMIQHRIRIKHVYFVDLQYIGDTKSKIEQTIRDFNQELSFPYEVSNQFPPGLTWQANGRLVIAFSKLIHWASTYANIAHFLTKNWTYVLRNCQEQNIAFIDLFFHIDPKTGKLQISDFSDLTQPPLTKFKDYEFIGANWYELWTEYVKQMIEPGFRAGVQRMTVLDGGYEKYCAKYNVMTPNDARDFASNLCKLCGRKDLKGTKRERTY